MHPTRLAPLAPGDWSDDARKVLDKLARPDGSVLNIFATLARHPKLLQRWLVFGTHVLMQSTLDAREREIAILRVGWRCGSEYEWGQHVEIAKQLGLDDADIARIREGADAAGWGERDRLLLRAADELHDDKRIGDATWKGLVEHYSEQQILDLVFAVGQYTLVSMALNTLGVPLDEGIEGFGPSD
jgi:alkylhydroperoxidase family enzyme